MSATNLPETPHCEQFDFLISQQSFATSIQDVLIIGIFSKTESLVAKFGAQSSAPERDAVKAK